MNIFTRLFKDWKEFLEYRSTAAKKRKDVTLVLQHTLYWTGTNALGESTPFQLMYCLYENGLGERTLEYSTSISRDKQALDNMVNTDSDYVTIFKPWLKGAYVKEVPSVEDAKQKILIEKLKK